MLYSLPSKAVVDSAWFPAAFFKKLFAERALYGLILNLFGTEWTFHFISSAQDIDSFLFYGALKKSAATLCVLLL